LAVAFVERCLREGNRLAIANKRQYPQIVSGLWIGNLVRDGLAVRRPAHWDDDSASGLKQQIFVARAIRGLLVQTPGSASERSEHDLGAVRRPDRRHVFHRGIERESRRRAAGALEDPDVAALSFVTMERDPRAVGREIDAAIRRGWAGRLDHLALPIEPAHLYGIAERATGPIGQNPVE